MKTIKCFPFLPNLLISTGYSNNVNAQVLKRVQRKIAIATDISLSQKRADAVKMAIIHSGIATSRLSTLGKSEPEALNNHSKSKDKANNRRVAFVLNNETTSGPRGIRNRTSSKF